MKTIGKTVLILLLLSLIGGAVAYALSFVNFHRKANISGIVTRDGKPLEWQSETRELFVVFVPADRDLDPKLYRAGRTNAETGEFWVDDIPIGRFFVSIQQQDPDGRFDLLKFAYPIHNEHLKAEVTENGQRIMIDLPKVLPEGSRPGIPGGGPDGAAKKVKRKTGDKKQSPPTDAAKEKPKEGK